MTHSDVPRADDGSRSAAPEMSTRRHSLVGTAIAFAILGTWGGHLTVLLTLGLDGVPLWTIPAAIALQTFLHTGLFITAHDAMHGTVCPAHRGFNDAIGAVAVRLYALFSYEALRHEHHRHHAHPVTEDDPDAADEGRAGFWHWYGDFLWTYVGIGQLIGMAVVYNVLMHGIGISAWTLNLFWVLPSLLSTLQLFGFGTYLPHRRTSTEFRDAHRARSNDFSPLFSFLTCYHFGYHWEHHARPELPWWRLPAYRRRRQSGTTQAPPDASHD